MNDSQTIRYIAGNFHSLQGLTGVPLGFLLILIGLGKRFRWPALQWESPLIQAVIILALLFIIASKYFYRRRYGTVRPRSAMKRFWIELLGIFALIGLIYLDITLFADIPISFTVLGFACYYIFYPFIGEYRRRDYVICWALLAAIAISPLFDIASKADLLLFGWLNYLSLGAAIVLGGLLDHRFLSRNLTSSSGA